MRGSPGAFSPTRPLSPCDLVTLVSFCLSQPCPRALALAAKSLQSCPILCTRLLCPWGSPGTGRLHRKSVPDFPTGVQSHKESFPATFSKGTPPVRLTASSFSHSRHHSAVLSFTVLFTRLLPVPLLKKKSSMRAEACLVGSLCQARNRQAIFAASMNEDTEILQIPVLAQVKHFLDFP